MKDFYHIYGGFLLAFVSRECFGTEKRWLPNLEWQSASNWENDRVPEDDSHVIFPLETRHAVGIAKSADLRLSEIDLPRHGSLVLPRDGKLELGQSRSTEKKVSRWLKEGHFFWADPENWKGSSEAAPHVERVPCRQDDIVLPEAEHTLSILLPIKEIRVKSVRSLDQRYPFTRWQWQDLQEQREFAGRRFTVKYSQYNCEKCSCQDDSRGDYIEEVCAIQRARCGFTGCEYPLRVEGHCCRYCGGRISLAKEVSLPIVRILVNETLEGYSKKIAWYVRRRSDGEIEILLKEKGDYSGVDVADATDYTKRALQNAGIEVVNTETTGAALQDNRLAVALGPLFGTPLIVIAFLVLGFAYFGYSFEHVLSGCTEAFTSVRDGVRASKSQSRKPFDFARFENIPECNVEIADVSNTARRQVESKDDGSKSSPSGGRFENPLYRSKRKREDEGKILDVQVPLSLAALEDKASDHIEEVEMDID